MIKENANKNSSVIIFDIIEKRLNYLWHSSDRIDAKACTLIGFEGVIISILFSTYSFVKPEVNIFVIGIIFLFISLLLAILSIKSYEFRMDPNPRGLYEGYIEKEEGDTLKAITINIIYSFEKNEKINCKKVKLLNYGFYFMLFSLILIILSVSRFDFILNVFKEVF